LYNCNFSGGGVGTGVVVRNCGGLQWVGGEALNKNIGLNIAPDLRGRRVNGVRINSVYLDTCTNSCLNMAVIAGTRIHDAIFVNTHFNASQNDSGVIVGGLSSDATLINSIRFVACNAIINKKFGFYLSYCQKIDIADCGIISSGVDGVSDGVVVSAGCSGVKILGGQSGQGADFGANQQYGINIAGGVTNVVIDGVDLTGNVTGPIVDSGTGTVITNCLGYKTFSKGASSVASGASSTTINHGLGFTPAKEDVFITPVSDLQGLRSWVSAVTSTTFTVSLSANAPAQLFFGWSAGVKGS